ncbi:hypothetical protein Avbf_08875 [Armadillidium vulgare]|nr:hypothetical protein Avbf_08875 [Armadillidium vulgare]
MALIHSARSFQNAAPRLLTTSRFDFWVGTIVLNSQAIYKMWTILACLVNLGIMIVDVAKVSENEKPIDDVANNTCIGILVFSTCSLHYLFRIGADLVYEAQKYNFYSLFSLYMGFNCDPCETRKLGVPHCPILNNSQYCIRRFASDIEDCLYHLS